MATAPWNFTVVKHVEEPNISKIFQYLRFCDESKVSDVWWWSEFSNIILTIFTNLFSNWLALLFIDSVALFFLSIHLISKFYVLIYLLTCTMSHCCSCTVLHFCSSTILHSRSCLILHSSPHSGSRKHSSDTLNTSLTREQVFPFNLAGEPERSHGHKAVTRIKIWECKQHLNRP